MDIDDLDIESIVQRQLSLLEDDYLEIQNHTIQNDLKSNDNIHITENSLRTITPSKSIEHECSAQNENESDYCNEEDDSGYLMLENYEDLIDHFSESESESEDMQVEPVISDDIDTTITTTKPIEDWQEIAAVCLAPPPPIESIQTQNSTNSQLPLLIRREANLDLDQWVASISPDQLISMLNEDFSLLEKSSYTK